MRVGNGKRKEENVKRKEENVKRGVYSVFRITFYVTEAPPTSLALS